MCSLWNKGTQIENVLEKYKNHYITNSLDGDKTIHDVYVFYCNYLNNSSGSPYNILIVDKSYFVDYIKKYLNPYIDDNYISSIWFNG